MKWVCDIYETRTQVCNLVTKVKLTACQIWLWCPFMSFTFQPGWVCARRHNGLKYSYFPETKFSIYYSRHYNSWFVFFQASFWSREIFRDRTRKLGFMDYFWKICYICLISVFLAITNIFDEFKYIDMKIDLKIDIKIVMKIKLIWKLSWFEN